MSWEGLNFQNVHLPFSAGLLQRSDKRAKPVPYLDIANDVQFDELGGVQTRYPFDAVTSTSIIGGGTLANCRRLVANGDELLVFTDTQLYSWNAQLEKWALRGSHLACKVEEASVFISADDQIDTDRAELDGVIVYAWATTGGAVYVAAIDKETGSVALDPYEVANDGVSSTGARPRLVALESVIHLYWVDTTGAANDLVLLALDPADLSSTVQAAKTVVENGMNLYYDVVKVPNSDQAIGAMRLTPTTSYELFLADADPGTITYSTKARACTGPIAVSCEPTGAKVQIARANGDDIKGDLITIAGFVDTAHVTKAIGTNPLGSLVNQVTACHRSVTDSGQYRCYVFWHANEFTGVSDWYSKANYVDTGGTLGVEATFVKKAAVASRAFDYAGRVFVHLAFASSSSNISRDFKMQLQNSFFLYRDDGFLTAKICPVRGGGFPPSIGRLPHVELVDSKTYAWCATERRIVRVGAKHLGYEDRGPRDVKLTFDSNEARRCVRLGQTLYITGGEILQYDGLRLVELGFHIYPWGIGGSQHGGGTGLGEGAFSYKATMRDTNARGDRDRSTTASHADTEVAAGTGPDSMDVTVVPLYITHRHFNSGSDRNPAVEIWRTEVDAGQGADFNLVTSKDPIDTGSNGYLANNPTQSFLSLNDDLTDEDLEEEESNPENGGVLENLSPPAGTILIATDTRLFLAGIAGDPDAVWYSKQRGESEVASFHDALRALVPTVGGKVTGLAIHNETLTAFRETAIYRLAGDGIDNGGGGFNFAALEVSTDVGAINHESILSTPIGTIFKSKKGWQLLDRGWGVQYIGGPVKDYDAEEVLAVDIVESQHHVRILTSGRMLLWNYPATPDEGRGQWAEWTIANGVHAGIWAGSHVYLTSGGPRVQSATYANLDYGIDVETGWIKPLDLQGEVMIDKLEILGEYRSSDLTHLLIQEKYNYNDATVVHSRYWPVSPTTVGGPLQAKIGLRRPRCESFKLRITAIRRHTTFVDDVETVVNDPPTGEALKLTGLALRVGPMNDLYSQLPAAQRS
jgi:hypothetical protein